MQIFHGTDESHKLDEDEDEKKMKVKTETTGPEVGSYCSAWVLKKTDRDSTKLHVRISTRLSASKLLTNIRMRLLKKRIEIGLYGPVWGNARTEPRPMGLLVPGDANMDREAWCAYVFDVTNSYMSITKGQWAPKNKSNFYDEKSVQFWSWI